MENWQRTKLLDGIVYERFESLHASQVRTTANKDEHTWKEPLKSWNVRHFSPRCRYCKCRSDNFNGPIDSGIFFRWHHTRCQFQLLDNSREITTLIWLLDRLLLSYCRDLEPTSHILTSQHSLVNFFCSLVVFTSQFLLLYALLYLLRSSIKARSLSVFIWAMK